MNSPYTVMVYTKYLGPTDTMGSRIKASTPMPSGKPVVVGYDHALRGSDAHQVAADRLIQEYVARNPYLAGATLVCHGDTPDSKGYAFAYRVEYKEN